ncbi:MAG: prephenate dehydratase [Acidimicrobiales bacterium]
MAPPAASVRIAYLGPEGTFTHQAIARARGLPAGMVAVAATTVADVVEAVAGGDAAFGIVPFENSVEGQVNLAVDTLIAHADRVRVRDEVVLGVTFGSYRHPHDHGPVSGVLSHPVALAQCRRWLRAAGPGVAHHETSSTAEACRIVATGGRPGLVAVASPIAAATFGLVAVAEGIEDVPGAETRFVVVGADDAEPTGADRTMALVTPPSEGAGILLRVLRPISDRGVNISAIASRPLRARLGTYCFLLVVDRHRRDPDLAAALAELEADGATVRHLGSYPAWTSPGD